MRVLFLDDDVDRQRLFRKVCPSADIVSTAVECIGKLRDGVYDLAFLDHDLGGEVYVDSGREDCGMEVVRWLESQGWLLPTAFVVHSCNRPASLRMNDTLIECGYDVALVPFMLGVERVFQVGEKMAAAAK